MSNPNMDHEEVARLYARYFENLEPGNVDDIHPLISDDIHFVDPFNDIVGRDKVIRVVEKMFEDVKNPRFEILDLAWSNGLCLMRWDFSCHQRFLGSWKVRGITELAFDDQGRVCSHIDYWDAARHFFSRIPIIGFLIGQVVRRARI